MVEGHRCQSARKQSRKEEETFGWGRERRGDGRRDRGHLDKEGERQVGGLAH